MTTLAVANFVRLTPRSESGDPASNNYGNYSTLLYAFQNFYIKQSVSFDSISHVFLPFGFSGVTVNRSGDGTDASLVFPNNELSKSWIDAAIKGRWFVDVDVVLVDPDNPGGSTTKVHSYAGQTSGGRWDQTTVSIGVNTILDAVGADVPRRHLTQNLVGHLPVTSNVQLR